MHAARRGDSGLISVSLTEVLIRVGLITVLAVLCFKIFSPFLGLMLWALILAVILYPLHQKIARRMGNRQGPAATVLVLLGLLLIGTPTLMLGNSFAGHVHDLYSKFHSGSVSIKPPPTAVAEWPIVGKKVFGLWTEAADNLPAVLQTLKPQLEGFAKTALSAVASTASGIFQFLGSPIVAGIMMAYGRSGTDAMLKVASRLTSPKKGRALHSLSTLTIRSVAMGVVGVAFIQALLIGVGLVWADVPAAGLLSIVVLLTGIAQLPALIVTLPVIVYIWSTGDSTAMNVAYTIYLFIAGMADNFIKPLLLGRGVDIPMPVV
ncbi:MAG: AI-2E family transporter, partial [Thiotrichales bacterium]